MAIDKITMISLTVSDQEEAKSFYNAKLGFKETTDYSWGSQKK